MSAHGYTNSPKMAQIRRSISSCRLAVLASRLLSAWQTIRPQPRGGQRFNGRNHDECCGYELDAGVDGAGAADDARSRVLLWRSGALEERAQHDDDELHLARLRGRAVGRRRLLVVVCAGLELDRRS